MHAFWHILGELFAWPAGIVVGNLIASALWATPALWHLHRKLNRHHREHLAAIRGEASSAVQIAPAEEASERRVGSG